MVDYKLGNFTFSTEEEYQKALKEAKTVKLISERYDISDASKAKVILSKFKAETSIGEAFRRKLKSTCEQAEKEAKLFDEIDSEMERSERLHAKQSYDNRTSAVPSNNTSSRNRSYDNNADKSNSNDNTTYIRKMSNENFQPTGSFSVSVDAGGITVADRYYGFKEIGKIAFQKISGEKANVDLTLKNASHVVFSLSFRSGVFLCLNRSAIDNDIPVFNKGCPEIFKKNGRVNLPGFAKLLVSTKDLILSIILSSFVAFILDIIVVVRTRTKVDAFQSMNAFLAVTFGFLVFFLVQDLGIGSGAPGNSVVIGIILGVLSVLGVGVILTVIIMGIGLDHINLGIVVAYTIVISIMVIMSNMIMKLVQISKQLTNV